MENTHLAKSTSIDDTIRSEIVPVDSCDEVINYASKSLLEWESNEQANVVIGVGIHRQKIKQQEE